MTDGGEPAAPMPQRAARWLAASAHRPVLIAAAFFMVPLLMPLSAAMIAFVALLRGPQVGAIASLAAAAIVGIVVLLSGGAAFGVFTAGLLILTLVSLAATLLARSGSLSLTLQVCVLATAVLAGILGSAMPAAELREALAAEFMQQLGATQGDVDAVAAMLANLVFGLALAGLLLSVTVALLLARGLQGLAEGQALAAAGFHQLSLGRLVSGVATVVLVGAWLLEWPALTNMTVVFVLAFTLQGLAVVHATVARRGWNPLWLVMVYAIALLPTPLAPVVMIGLMTAGYLDNWLGLRPTVAIGEHPPQD